MKSEEVLLKTKDICRLKRYSHATEKTYLFWIQSYIKELGTMPGEWASEQKAAEFLTRLAKRDVAAATQSQALNALVFLYGHVLCVPLGNVDALRVRRPAMVRTALSVEDVRALLAVVGDVGGYPTRLVVRLLYGCGLRVTEPLELRVKDVDVEECRIVVRNGKGNKDRVVALPDCLKDEMMAQLRLARAVSKSDAETGLAVALPGLLARKKPKARFDTGWAWVFPAAKATTHPQTKEPLRWRMHEVNVQRAVRTAARKAGLSVNVTPHVLRHTFATHAHRAGATARDLQETLGHTKLETTMGYLEALPTGVRSPLDDL